MDFIVLLQVELVVLGQSTKVFSKSGFNDIEKWEAVTAVARRRRCFYNGKDTLACFIASVSDIDDVIPMLTAYQTEWNKIHTLLKRSPTLYLDHDTQRSLSEKELHELAFSLSISQDDMDRLKTN
jgi:hypothetical protein